jgi:TPR repeat protein
MSNLAEGLAAFESEDYTNAFRLLKPLADQGNPEAQCLIANMYHLGLAVERDILEAVKWYEKSSEQGYGIASNNLAGIFLMCDSGIAADRDEAEKWNLKARQQGFLHTSG